MLTYIAAFIFYTMAMIGVMLVGFLIYKKTMQPMKNQNKNMIKILDSLPIAPKKTLHIVKVKNEKFLIASDEQSTTFLAKLNEQDNIQPKRETAIETRVERQVEETPKNDKFDRMRNQFRQLYSVPQNTIQNSQQSESTSDRKEMIKRLLKDLNDTPTLQAGSNY